METYVAFDIETLDKAPNEIVPLDEWRLIPISCASLVEFTVENDGSIVLLNEAEAWHGEFGHAMLPSKVEGFVNALLSYPAERVVGSNSLGFDWPVLYANTNDPILRQAIIRHAVNHIDPCWWAICGLGFGVGVGPTAKAMGIEGKTEGMTGLEAIEAWATGDPDTCNLILDYVKRDAIMTAEVFGNLHVSRKWPRISSKSGKLINWDMQRTGIPTVNEAAKHGVVKTPWWPENPFSRKRTSGWLGFHLPIASDGGIDNCIYVLARDRALNATNDTEVENMEALVEIMPETRLMSVVKSQRDERAAIAKKQYDALRTAVVGRVLAGDPVSHPAITSIQTREFVTLAPDTEYALKQYCIEHGLLATIKLNMREVLKDSGARAVLLEHGAIEIKPVPSIKSDLTHYLEGPLVHVRNVSKMLEAMVERDEYDAREKAKAEKVETEAAAGKVLEQQPLHLEETLNMEEPRPGDES